MPRILPLDDLPQDIEQTLVSMMPKGVPPLKLFRTLAKNPRILEKLQLSNLLDRGLLTLEEREIIINRTTALSGAQYELGVHIAFFAEKVGFNKDQLQSLVSGRWDDPCWSEQSKILLKMCDELHRTSVIEDETYNDLRGCWTDDQIIEAVTVAGYYKMISYLVNVIDPEMETYAAAALA